MAADNAAPLAMRLPRRFDNALMTPPDERSAVDAALLATLRDWCEGGMVPMEPLRVASIAPQPGLDGAACVLDGSHDLARMGRWRGLWWRLQILGRECFGGRNGQPEAPWDCGWWRAGSLGPASAFHARRATLLMLREPDFAVAAALISTLRASSPARVQPLRVLVVSTVAMTGVERL